MKVGDLVKCLNFLASPTGIVVEVSPSIEVYVEGRIVSMRPRDELEIISESKKMKKD